jgi:hypothetical protein
VTSERHTQYIALTLIAGACVCIAIGEWRNWLHLVDFASTFGGGGVGILTGQRLSQQTAKDGGTVINEATATPAKE